MTLLCSIFFTIITASRPQKPWTFFCLVGTYYTLLFRCHRIARTIWKRILGLINLSNYYCYHGYCYRFNCIIITTYWLPRSHTNVYLGHVPRAAYRVTFLRISQTAARGHTHHRCHNNTVYDLQVINSY